jgi:hypothetical protein
LYDNLEAILLILGNFYLLKQGSKYKEGMKFMPLMNYGCIRLDKESREKIVLMWRYWVMS